MKKKYIERFGWCRRNIATLLIADIFYNVVKVLI